MRMIKWKFREKRYPDIDIMGRETSQLLQIQTPWTNHSVFCDFLFCSAVVVPKLQWMLLITLWGNANNQMVCFYRSWVPWPLLGHNGREGWQLRAVLPPALLGAANSSEKSPWFHISAQWALQRSQAQLCLEIRGWVASLSLFLKASY